MVTSKNDNTKIYTPKINNKKKKKKNLNTKEKGKKEKRTFSLNVNLSKVITIIRRVRDIADISGRMWYFCLRHILRIPYIAHVTNDDVRRRTCQSPATLLITRRLRLFGHIARAAHHKTTHKLSERSSTEFAELEIAGPENDGLLIGKLTEH